MRGREAEKEGGREEGVTVWKIQSGATALSDQGTGWRKFRYCYCTR